MGTFFQDFRTITSAMLADKQPILRGELYDPEAGVACVTGVMFIQSHVSPTARGLDSKTLKSLVKGRKWRITPDSAEAKQLLNMTQFEVDSALAKRYNEPLWGVMVGVTAEDVDVIALAQQKRPADLFGQAGAPIVKFMQYLGTRDATAWEHIREIASEEFADVETRSKSEVQAFKAAAAAYSPQVVAMAQLWARSVAWRHAYGAVVASRRDKKGLNEHDLEFDMAWPAWAADLARRGAIEILARAAGKAVRQSTLRFLGLKYESLT